MHLNAKRITLLLLVLIIAFPPQPLAAFQQPEPTVKAPGKETDALVMRVRALRFLDRDKEALDVFETASAEVKARAAQYVESTSQVRGSQWAVEQAQQTIRNYSTPAIVSSARLILGQYNAAVQVGGEAIRSQERTNTLLTGDKRDAYLSLAHQYGERAVASSAAGNRIGSQRDFQTALELCRKADCEALWEGNLYLSRALSSFLIGDLSMASNDCKVFLQFGPIFGSRQKDAEEMCSYVLSNTSTQATAGAKTGEPDSIRGEIEQIVRGGKYSPLPPIVSAGLSMSPTGMAICEVKNDTAYALTALFSGPTERRVVLSPQGSISVELLPGSYKVVGRVNASNVLPSYGEHIFDRSRAGLTFYIQ